MTTGHCRLCGEEVIVTLIALTGRIVELTPEIIEPIPGAAAYDQRSGLCHIFRKSDLGRIELWTHDDVSVHHLHPATCSRIEHWRRPIRSTT